MIKIGSARCDENGRYTKGKVGDQRQVSSPDERGEVSMQPFYVHRKGWIVAHPIDDDLGHDLAVNMKRACNNKNIGYSQSDRYGIMKYGTGTKVKCNTDCSELVRKCLQEAGVNVDDFTTYNEVAVLRKTGLFVIYKYDPKLTKLYNGDILTTSTKGHTAIVVSGAIARKRRKKK